MPRLFQGMWEFSLMNLSGYDGILIAPKAQFLYWNILGMESVRNDSSMVRGYYNYACTISMHVGTFSDEFWQPQHHPDCAKSKCPILE